MIEKQGRRVMGDEIFERDPSITDEAWCAAFVEFMVRVGGPRYAGDATELREYAEDAAKAYLPDRREYIDAAEAAGTDISYWEED